MAGWLQPGDCRPGPRRIDHRARGLRRCCPRARGDPIRHAALASCTALLVAAIAFAAYAIRAGTLVNFFSETVLIGFKVGVALFLASSQLPKLFGFSAGHGGDFWARMTHFFQGLGGTNPALLVLGLLALVLLLLGKTVLKGRPVSLFVVIGGIVAARLLHLDERGVALLGDVPQGLPTPALPAVAWTDAREVFPLAPACFMLAAVETTAIGRMFAARHQYRLDATQEFLALGSANLLAGVGRGFPVSGGMSQSLVNETAGARTPLSGLIAAILTLIVVVFFTGLLRTLPQPVLAAVVLMAVTGADPDRRVAPDLALQPLGICRGDGGPPGSARGWIASGCADRRGHFDPASHSPSRQAPDRGSGARAGDLLLCRTRPISRE
ncbi:MAG TPA: SulP family inorganic anion transporter [Vicinamibacterales bacterium]|nr:SulP family inorganic anion transporter [Vicinamibacterales bacterium]